MADKKPARSVSSMNVLGDIRGLLSVNREPGAVKEKPTGEKSQADTDSLRNELEHLKTIVEKQKAEIDGLKTEKNTLAEEHLAEISSLKNENKALLEKQKEATSRPKPDVDEQSRKLQAEIDKLKAENKAILEQRKDEAAQKMDTDSRFKKLLSEAEKLKGENDALLRNSQEVDTLKEENKKLLARLEAAKSGPAAATAVKPDIEMERMEANKEELSLALEQVENLLQLRSKELMNRLARVFQEAAQGEIALEFRRGRDQLESLENLAHFVQALLNE